MFVVPGYMPSDGGEKWNEEPQVPVTMALSSEEPLEPVDMETADNQLLSGLQQDTSIQRTVIKPSINHSEVCIALYAQNYHHCAFCLFVSVGSDGSKQLEDLREQLKATLEFCLSR